MEFENLGIVLVTVASEEEAHEISSALIEYNLAACVNFYAVTSVYKWQEKLHCGEEWQLTIKTDLNNFSALATKIREIHSYEVPEIIALPIVNGSIAYLQWLKNSVQTTQEG